MAVLLAQHVLSTNPWPPCVSLAYFKTQRLSYTFTKFWSTIKVSTCVPWLVNHVSSLNLPHKCVDKSQIDHNCVFWVSIRIFNFHSVYFSKQINPLYPQFISKVFWQKFFCMYLHIHGLLTLTGGNIPYHY